jgi:hypothetical protein
MILALALALALLQEVGGTVRGEVTSESTGAPLVGAMVEARSAGSARSALTNSTGAYTLRNVPAGRQRVRASFLGYEPLELEVLVSPGAELTLDLALRLRPVALEGVIVRGTLLGSAIDTVPLSPPSLGLAGIRALEASTPGLAEMGFGDAYQGAPGHPPVDPTDVLYVRGAPADLKLVLLDGAPVYTPFHVAGLLDSFEVDVLRSASLHLGGAPARYDGGLSYVMELNTRSGRSGHARSSGSVDMMSARATVDGSAGDRVRYLAAGRGIHGLGVSPWISGGFPYSYSEGLLRMDAELARDHVLSVTAFRNREGVSVDSVGQPGRHAGWGNRAASLRYRGRIAGRDGELTAAYGGYDATLPVAGGRAFPASGGTDRLRLTADIVEGGAALQMRYGASFDHLVLSRRAPGPGGPARFPGTESQLAGASAGGYLEAAWQVSPRVRLRGGGRTDLFLTENTPRLAPRLAATWMLSERAALTAAAGKYHQYVRAVGGESLGLPAALAVGQATHLNLTLHQSMDDGLRLGVEGFFKTFEGPDASLDESYASGLDLWVRRDEGRFRGWLGYSLSWVWSHGHLATETGVHTGDSFAGRQILSAGMSGPLGRLADVELRAAYGAGLPFTAIPVSVNAPAFGLDNRRYMEMSGPTQGLADTQPMPGAPMEPYLRLDLGLSRAVHTRLNGSPVHFTPYLRVLNSLDRRDALFYWYDRNSEHGPRAIAALPVVPIVGMSWRF